MAVVSLSPLSLTPIFDNNGALVRNARLYFYKPSTLDPVTVYQDQALGAPHTQPILTGGSGRVPPIYVGPQEYRVRIFDNANQLVVDIPWLPGAVEAGEGGAGGSDTAIRTGDIVWNYSNGGVRTGWVRCNGGTIGNALSGATERANDDAQALFVYLWGQDTGNQLAVVPSKGASAVSDWLANKTIEVPDLRNRLLAGISTMGGVASARMSGGVFTAGAPDVVGSRGGNPAETLTVAQIPAHNHGVNDPGHAHGASQPAHSHPVNDPGHNHWLQQSPHSHGISDPGHTHHVHDPGHAHGVYDPGHAHGYTRTDDGGFRAGGGGPVPDPSQVDAGTAAAVTNIGIQAAATGIWLGGSGTGIGILGQNANLTLHAASCGITLGGYAPPITVNGAATGITTQNNGGGVAHNNLQPFLLATAYMKL